MISTRTLRQWEQALAGDSDWHASGTELLDVIRELLARREGRPAQPTQSVLVAGLQRSADVWLGEAQAARRDLADLQIRLAQMPTREEVHAWTLDAFSCLAEWPADADPTVADHHARLIDQAAGWLRLAARDSDG